MSEPVKKVTDAKLSECLAKGGGFCPFCGSDKAECLNSEHQDDVVIEKWACCTEGCPGNVRGWTQILSLSEIYVSEDDAAEGETGYSKPPWTQLEKIQDKIISDLRAAAGKLMWSARNYLGCSGTKSTCADCGPHLADAVAEVENLLPKES